MSAHVSREFAPALAPPLGDMLDDSALTDSSDVEDDCAPHAAPAKRRASSSVAQRYGRRASHGATQDEISGLESGLAAVGSGLNMPKMGAANARRASNSSTVGARRHDLMLNPVLGSLDARRDSAVRRRDAFISAGEGSNPLVDSHVNGTILESPPVDANLLDPIELEFAVGAPAPAHMVSHSTALAYPSEQKDAERTISEHVYPPISPTGRVHDPEHGPAPISELLEVQDEPIPDRLWTKRGIGILVVTGTAQVYTITILFIYEPHCLLSSYLTIFF
jgi:hypothetical protein